MFHHFSLHASGVFPFLFPYQNHPTRQMFLGAVVENHKTPPVKLPQHNYNQQHTQARRLLKHCYFTLFATNAMLQKSAPHHWSRLIRTRLQLCSRLHQKKNTITWLSETAPERLQLAESNANKPQFLNGRFGRFMGSFGSFSARTGVSEKRKARRGSGHFRVQ